MPDSEESSSSSSSSDSEDDSSSSSSSSSSSGEEVKKKKTTEKETSKNQKETSKKQKETSKKEKETTKKKKKTTKKVRKRSNSSSSDEEEETPKKKKKTEKVEKKKSADDEVNGDPESAVASAAAAAKDKCNGNVEDSAKEKVSELGNGNHRAEEETEKGEAEKDKTSKSEEKDRNDMPPPSQPPPPRQEAQEEEEEDEWIGPMPSEAVAKKKRKTLPFERVYLNNLPSAQAYEKSFMHREAVTHLSVSTKTNFLMTASQDGHVKFWHKMDAGANTQAKPSSGAAEMDLLGSKSSSETSTKGQRGIEFVKHYRTHLAPIQDMQISPDGCIAATVSQEKTCKVFDVINFDMINMLKLDFVPVCCGWIFQSGDPISCLAVACKDTHTIHIFNARGDNVPIHVVEKLHGGQIAFIKYSPTLDLVISGDRNGMLEYWSGPRNDYKFPKSAAWEFKTDTDLYEFVKNQTWTPNLTFSPDGKSFATLAVDRKVRIFSTITGKLKKVIDESLQQYTELQQSKQQLPNMEFGRRMAVEKEIDRNNGMEYANVVFDETGHFLLYATMLGIKIVNLTTNRVATMLGKMENARFMNVAMLQRSTTSRAALTLEMHTSENPGLTADGFTDPILFATALKKNRFYLFTRFEPEWTKDENVNSSDRDVFNEKPSKEELVSATEDSSSARVAASAIIHTTMGDIQMRLFYKECPKSVENFVVHAREGYYNGHLFHRVIKGFMVQTGDPTGTGCGGESIWGGEFEDEFHPSLKHDRPYTVSMANAGPGTNGSQFFITVVPTPWLDNKHTVFARVEKGMEVVQKMSLAKVNKKNDKPYDDVNIISITVK